MYDTILLLKEGASMWNHDYSLKLSIWALRCFFLAWCAFTLFGYFITKSYVNYNGILEAFPVILITLYLCLAVAIFLLYDLHRLLHNLQMEQVFISENISYLRQISWLCMSVALITLVATLGYVPFILVAVTFAFIALIVRVVKNVFAEAMVLKEEHDYTI